MRDLYLDPMAACKAASCDTICAGDCVPSVFGSATATLGAELWRLLSEAMLLPMQSTGQVRSSQVSLQTVQTVRSSHGKKLRSAESRFQPGCSAPTPMQCLFRMRWLWYESCSCTSCLIVRGFLRRAQEAPRSASTLEPLVAPRIAPSRCAPPCPAFRPRDTLLPTPSRKRSKAE